jgi:sugar phosphate isomerase/epimerase
MLSRRTMLLTPVALAAARGAAAASKMTLAMHQNTSSRAGFRRSLEGWSRAGITQVEITGNLLDDFVKTESLAAAGRLLSDLGLTAVSCTPGPLQGLWEQNPNRGAALDTFKRHCERFNTLGLKRIYAPTTMPQQKVTAEDYKPVPDNMREVGESAKQFDMTAMAEFVRTSPLIATLPTLLKLTRAAAHPNMRPMLDCYHFWSGLNKLEDLDLLKPGELGHVHFQDVPDMPRELLDTVTRVIPGDGVSPLTAILRKLAEKGYTGPLSVELLSPTFQQTDPFELAREIRPKAEAVMRQARVL